MVKKNNFNQSAQFLGFCPGPGSRGRQFSVGQAYEFFYQQPREKTPPRLSAAGTASNNIPIPSLSIKPPITST